MPTSAANDCLRCGVAARAPSTRRKRVDGAGRAGLKLFVTLICPTYSQNEPNVHYGLTRVIGYCTQHMGDDVHEYVCGRTFPDPNRRMSPRSHRWRHICSLL